MIGLINNINFINSHKIITTLFSLESITKYKIRVWNILLINITTKYSVIEFKQLESSYLAINDLHFINVSTNNAIIVSNSTVNI